MRIKISLSLFLSYQYKFKPLWYRHLEDLNMTYYYFVNGNYHNFDMAISDNSDNDVGEKKKEKKKKEKIPMVGPIELVRFPTHPIVANTVLAL